MKITRRANPVTDLIKRIRRRTVAAYSHHRRRRLVVILMPGDVIGIREERCRKVFMAPIDRVYRQIVTWNVEAERQQRRKARANRVARR
jgi:hypothetical protein